MSDWIWWEQLHWGFRLSNGDVIKVTSVEDGVQNEVEFVLTTVSGITWAKSIGVVGSPVNWGEAFTANDNHGPSSLKINAIPVLLTNAGLEFRKAAFLGIHTGLYKVGDLLRYNGKKVTFEWQWDWGGPGAPSPTPPVPGA